MHSSLKLRTNIILILACALVASAVSIQTHPFPAIPLLTGAIFGVAAGFMQNQSIALAPDAFRNAQTAMEVRHAITSTRAGKRAIQIQWALLPFLLLSAFWIGNPLGGAVAGYTVFMCVRDVIAFKGVVGLSQRADATK